MASPLNPMNDLTASWSKACEETHAMMTNYIGAAAKSHSATCQGIEDLTRNMSAMMQECVARSLGVYSTIASAKSPQEAAGTHADFLKDSFESVLAGGSKLSEISMRTAQSAINPLAQHANDAVGSMMKKVSAVV